MGSVGRGENRAIFKLQEIGSDKRENNFQTHRFHQIVANHKEGRRIGRLWFGCLEKESGFLERVAVRVAEEKGVVFCGREGREGTRRVWRRKVWRRREGRRGRCLVQTREEEKAEGDVAQTREEEKEEKEEIRLG
ncbi:hypothetical protein OIU76_003131 [Salix suchowensis]|nr:hypothetical protein OIU76_003131 [Salix suchowensis]